MNSAHFNGTQFWLPSLSNNSNNGEFSINPINFLPPPPPSISPSVFCSNSFGVPPGCSVSSILEGIQQDSNNGIHINGINRSHYLNGLVNGNHNGQAADNHRPDNTTIAKLLKTNHNTSKESRERWNLKRKNQRHRHSKFLKMLRNEFPHVHIKESNACEFLFALAGFTYDKETFTITSRPTEFPKGIPGLTEDPDSELERNDSTPAS